LKMSEIHSFFGNLILILAKLVLLESIESGSLEEFKIFFRNN